MTTCPICGGIQSQHTSVLPGCECSHRMKLNHHPSLMWQMMKLDDEWKARLEAAVLAEREACAAFLDEYAKLFSRLLAEQALEGYFDLAARTHSEKCLVEFLADKIREKGQKECI